jgi:hypothetical protein
MGLANTMNRNKRTISKSNRGKSEEVHDDNILRELDM